MRRNIFIATVLVPLICFLLFKFQDGDFILMIYEKIGQDPAVALRGKVVWITQVLRAVAVNIWLMNWSNMAVN